MSSQIRVSDLSKNCIIARGHIFWFKNQQKAEAFSRYALIYGRAHMDPRIALNWLVYHYLYISKQP